MLNTLSPPCRALVHRKSIRYAGVPVSRRLLHILPVNLLVPLCLNNMKSFIVSSLAFAASVSAHAIFQVGLMMITLTGSVD